MCLPALRRGCRTDDLRWHHHLQGDQADRSKPGEWIAISGAGGLGHLAIQYAKAMGLLVCAIDIDDGKLAHAKRLGADLVINAKAGDPAAAVKKATGGGAHGVLITAPSLGAFKQGVGMTRKRGTCVLVGLPPGEFPVPLFDVVANCITIRGSFVGTRQDMAEALAFAAEGKVKADIELQPLSSINQVFDRLEHGDVASRVVLEFRDGLKRGTDTRTNLREPIVYPSGGAWCPSPMSPPGSSCLRPTLERARNADTRGTARRTDAMVLTSIGSSSSAPPP